MITQDGLIQKKIKLEPNPATGFYNVVESNSTLYPVGSQISDLTVLVNEGFQFDVNSPSNTSSIKKLVLG